MTRITIEENGRETVITDIAPYTRERDAVVTRLVAIYQDFERGPVEALGPREPEIVDLVNRFHFLTDVIGRFDQASVRRANLLAGWEIVKQHGGSGA